MTYFRPNPLREIILYNHKVTVFIDFFAVEVGLEMCDNGKHAPVTSGSGGTRVVC